MCMSSRGWGCSDYLELFSTILDTIAVVKDVLNYLFQKTVRPRENRRPRHSRRPATQLPGWHHRGRVGGAAPQLGLRTSPEPRRRIALRRRFRTLTPGGTD